ELACRSAGLRVVASGTAFGDQFLWCECRLAEPHSSSPPTSEQVDAVVAMARSFGRKAQERIRQAPLDVAAWAEKGPVVLWGAGSKGATYLNLVSDAADIAGVI